MSALPVFRNWRCGPGSNRLIALLQSVAFPLRHHTDPLPHAEDRFAANNGFGCTLVVRKTNEVLFETHELVALATMRDSVHLAVRVTAKTATMFALFF